MFMSDKYVYLDEHTADVAFIAYGDNLGEVFENAAEAMFNVITDIKKVEVKRCLSIRVEDSDLKGLLKKWLEELLFYFDAEGIVFSKFNVVIKKDEIYVLDGEACGENFNIDKHPSGIEVKAVSYHWMEIGEKNGKKFVRVVLDI